MAGSAPAKGALQVAYQFVNLLLGGIGLLLVDSGGHNACVLDFPVVADVTVLGLGAIIHARRTYAVS